jgi:hypothetical protein
MNVNYFVKEMCNVYPIGLSSKSSGPWGLYTWVRVNIDHQNPKSPQNRSKGCPTRIEKTFV